MSTNVGHDIYNTLLLMRLHLLLYICVHVQEKMEKMKKMYERDMKVNVISVLNPSRLQKVLLNI